MVPPTAYILLLPLAGVTVLLTLACGSVLAQSLGYVPAFGLTRLTLDYYWAALSKPEFFPFQTGTSGWYRCTRRFQCLLTRRRGSSSSP